MILTGLFDLNRNSICFSINMNLSNPNLPCYLPSVTLLHHYVHLYEWGER